jgi:hypothetical protein
MLINSYFAAIDQVSTAGLIRAQARALLSGGLIGALHTQLKRMPITQSTPQQYMWGSQEASTASEVARELASLLFQRSFHIAYGCEAPLWRLSLLVA